MLSTALLKRAAKSMLATGIFAAALAPFTPANAADAVEYTIHKDLTYRSTRLSLYHGSIVWESSTRFRVSFILCRDRSFTDPLVRIFINGQNPASHYGFIGEPGVTSPWCTNWGVQHDPPAVEYGSPVHNVKFEIRGVYFDGATNQATDRAETETYDNPFN